VKNLEPIRRVVVKDKTGKVTATVKADPEGFLTLSGGLLGCGRCGSAVVREFSGNHFKVCRHYWNLLRESRIIVPGEE
jgi:hypothetical protein